MKRDGWIVKCIGDCFSYIKNGANIKQEKNASGYPITRIETLSNGVFNRDRMGYADIFDIGKYNVNVLQDQDILMSHINSKAYIGRSVIYQKKDNETIIHGMNLLRLIAKKDFLNPYYANYYFKTESFKSDVAKIRKDAVNQSSMAISDLSKIKMPIPSLPEQSRIVKELDLLSNIIEKKRQQLSELDNLAQFIFYDMFGDPVANEKGWEVKKLEEIGKITSGGTPSRNKSEYFSGSINWYSAGELNTLYLSDSIEKITEKALQESAAKIFPKGSLMIGMYDTAAFKLGILNKDSASNQACANITLYKDCVLWLYYTLKLMREEALKYRHGARQKNLNVSFIKAFSVPIPLLDLQQLFAKKIEAIEKQKALIKQSIAETEELFISRMDYYFN